MECQWHVLQWLHLIRYKKDINSEELACLYAKNKREFKKSKNVEFYKFGKAAYMQALKTRDKPERGFAPQMSITTYPCGKDLVESMVVPPKLDRHHQPREKERERDVAKIAIRLES